MKTNQGFGFLTSSPPACVDYFNNQIPLKDVAATSPNPFLTDNFALYVLFVCEFVQILVFVVLINTTGTSEAETT